MTTSKTAASCLRDMVAAGNGVLEADGVGPRSQRGRQEEDVVLFARSNVLERFTYDRVGPHEGDEESGPVRWRQS